jgi:hypothetical protein
MAETTQTRELPALSLRATFEPATLDREKRTVEVTWTTGARVLRGFWDRYWEELSLDRAHVHLDRLNNGAPFLANHDSYNVVRTPGVVERAWLVKSEGVDVGRALVRFCRAGLDPEADTLFEKIADKIVTNCSVGYRIHRSEKIADAEDGIPVMRATSWTPYEISSVAIGADDGAGFRSVAKNETNPCEFITRGEAPQKETKMADEKTLPAPAAGDVVDDQKRIDANADSALKVAAERQRAAAITALAQRHGMSPGATAKLIADGSTLDAARTAILDEMAARSDAQPIQGNNSRITAGDDSRDKRLRGMAAWLLERSGKRQTLEAAAGHKQFGYRFKDMDLDGGEFRGMSLLDMARETLIANGQSVRGLDRMQLVTRALQFRSGGMQTTSDFAILFESAMYKLLLASYAMADDTWRLFAGTDSVPDFRDSNRYRLGSFGVADDLNEHGEFKQKAIPDGSKMSISTGTKGNIIAISRQAIINDDMSALSNVSTNFGRSFGLTIEVAVYALLAQNSGLGPTQTDTNPFFHSARANVNATASGITAAGLNADKVVMGSQKDPSSNEYLALRPSVLLVPLGLEADANLINEAQYDPADSKFMKPNIVRGLFSKVVGSPRLSGTRRYLFANDPSAPAIKVVFLEGAGEAPVVESEQGFEVDGMRWKARLDVKAQMFDPKGAVTNAGA